ncbi:MAG: hypothetical protein ACTSXW_00910 [Candidatus Baldrarchaeia archaeon]
MSKTMQRKEVAKEAARLLYYGLATEYYTAKRMAAKQLGTRFLPSNKEIALELDSLAEFLEGEERTQRLIQMRKTALKIMKILSGFQPKLIGSVWRGIITRNSDIDIYIYTRNIKEAIEKLKQAGYDITRVENIVRTIENTVKEYTHIFITTKENINIEIIIRGPEEINLKEKCEIFGDIIKGLTTEELEKILKKDPTKKFIPP